jgi:serine-type D-Ala-D-Ala carboxypeptidase/endopeptidase
MNRTLLAFALAASVLPSPAATREDQLRAAVEARFLGDRSGVCIAAALVGETTVTAFVNADPKQPRKLGEHTAFEIGSVSRTMASALLADLILKGEVSLDDPLAKLLPKGAKVPEFQGKPILLSHLLAHRSGLPSLPSRMRPADLDNPYAGITPEELLGSLEDVKLEAAPGAAYRNSNFGMMVLSYALAQKSGLDFQTLLSQRLFKPLGMEDAHIVRAVAADREAQGHQSNGRATGPWDFPVDMAGAGGVRASLADLVQYVQAELGRPSPITPALLSTQKPLEGFRPPVAMNWSIRTVGDRDLLYQEGSTGGFTSLVALDPERHQGVVLMADTALANVGGLAALGLSLLEPSLPAAGFPRRAATPGSVLVDGMVGRYLLGATRTAIEKKDGKLFSRTEGMPPLELAYDSAGDFYALDQDVLIHPVRTTSGYDFLLRQGGGQAKAERILNELAKPVDPAVLKEYVGEYPVLKEFSLKVVAKGTKLYVQGTNQPEVLVEAVAKDIFVSEASMAEFTFTRDEAGHVTGIIMKQAGRAFKAEKH